MTHDDATRLFYDYMWPHRAMVPRTAQFFTRNSVEAEDLAQETLVKAFKSIGQFDLSTKVEGAKAWISAILRNSWIDHLRAAGRHGQTITMEFQDFDLEDVHEPENLPDAKDSAALLEQFSDADVIRALRELPHEIRWTLMLVDVESFDHAEAARILQIPEGTVKSRAHRGRRMLRDRLVGHPSMAGRSSTLEGRS
jgi:RNA polymerase sigma-70 factor, ECF subfamily